MSELDVRIFTEKYGAAMGRVGYLPSGGLEYKR